MLEIFRDYLTLDPEELCEVLLSDYRTYEEIRLIMGQREVSGTKKKQVQDLKFTIQDRHIDNDKRSGC